MLNYKAADNKALTCGVICEDGLKLAREVEGLKVRKRLVYEASVGHTDHRTSATELLCYSWVRLWRMGMGVDF
jgi:hypothetical protein